VEPKLNIHQTRTPLPPLSGEEAKYVQEVAGTLLYYARAVDSTILPALSVITTKQEYPTEKAIGATIKQLLDYCAMQDKVVLACKASKMILAVHSDTGYCKKRNCGAKWGDIFSYPMTTNSPPTIVQSLPSQQ
jgi:hypothetical protein